MELRYWLENMRQHRYSSQEAAAATGLSSAAVRRLLKARELGLPEGDTSTIETAERPDVQEVRS